MKKFDFNRPERGTREYISPEIDVLPLGIESGFASSSQWEDGDESSPDFTINSVYDNEFE